MSVSLRPISGAPCTVNQGPVVVTGAAGFIGFHVARRLLSLGHAVVGFDNLNSYYSQSLKQARVASLAGYERWTFVEGDLADGVAVERLLGTASGGNVIHLGAQAGVRWALKNPRAYVESNLVGFANVLEQCRQRRVEHLIYASSSSVYGANTKTPFSEHDSASHPVSFYAATKRSNELMAHAYSHNFGIPTTGLRFFTVYGPWGRPDMAYWKFTESILLGRPVTVFGDGTFERDFTYVDDVVEAICRMVAMPARSREGWALAPPDQATSEAPWRIYNIGNHTPVSVGALLDILEEHCGKKAKRLHEAAPVGDVHRTFADVADLTRDFGFAPCTPLSVGLKAFVDWLRVWLDQQG